MKSKSQKGVLNFTTAVFYKLIVIIVGLIIPKLFIDSYGSELNGLRDSARHIFTYIALLESGIGVSTLQFLYRPVAQGDNDKTNSYLSAASVYYNKIGVIYFIVLVILGSIYACIVSVDSITKIEVIAYFLVSGALTGINFFYLAKLKLLIGAMGDQYIISVVTMVTYVISSIAKIVLIYCGSHIIVVETVYLIINLGATFVYYIFATKKYPWLSFKAKPDFECVKQKNAVLVHRISSVIFQNTDIVILTFFCDLKIVSIYGMYKMVVDMVTSIVGEIGNSVNFILGQKFNSETQCKKNYCSMIDIFNVYYSASAFALYSVAYLLMLPFLRVYTAGLDINYIYIALPPLYIAMEFLMVGREAMMRTIEVAGHFNKTQKSALIEAIINVVASIVFTIYGKSVFGNVGGIYGVLLGTIVALIYRTIDINIYANKCILERSSIKTFYIMFINACLFGSIAILSSFVSIELTGYIEFVIYGLVITLIVLIMFIFVHSILNLNEFKKIFTRILPRIKSYSFENIRKRK